MNVRLRTYERLKANRTLVDLYRESVADDSLTGVVAHFNNDFICMSLFAESGASNGISVFWSHDVSRIRWDSVELASINQLIAAKASTPFIPVIDISTMRRVLESVQKSCGHVTVHCERLETGVCFIGEVSELDEHHVILREFGTIKNRDAASILLPLEEITRIDAAGQYERDISMLAKTPLGSE